jgi:hypothetical protein
VEKAAQNYHFLSRKTSDISALQHVAVVETNL